MDEDVKAKFPTGHLGPLQGCPCTVVCMCAAHEGMAVDQSLASGLQGCFGLGLFSDSGEKYCNGVGWSNPQAGTCSHSQLWVLQDPA